MANTSKKDWIEQGLQVIAEDNVVALTIDLLCSRLSLTKGSFYHHFKSLQDYKHELLVYYEEAGTFQIIRLLEEEATPQVKIQKLGETTLLTMPGLEVGIRAWALQDAQAEEFQQRIDKKRQEYLEALCMDILHDQQRASLVAHLFYAVYVGSQQIRPPLSPDLLRQLYNELYSLYQLF